MNSRADLISCIDCEQQRLEGRRLVHAGVYAGSYCVDCWERRTAAVAAMSAPGADFAAVQEQFRRDKRNARKKRP